MNVTLRQLRVFLAVARAHSFSRAGDTIGLTQPAVSRSISELEGELGLKLLDRTTREVVLTEVGRSLATALERLVADLDDTLHQARQVGEQRRGRVVVASSPTVSTRLMPLYVAECAKRYPDIRMIVRDSVQVDTLQLIRGGGADFGVVIEPLDTEGLWTEPLLTDPFCLVCRRDHPFARRGSVRWKELHRTAIVLLDHASGSRPLLDRIFLRHGVQPDVAQEMGIPPPCSAWWRPASARAWCRRFRCRCRRRRNWCRCRLRRARRAASYWRGGMTARCRRRPRRHGR